MNLINAAAFLSKKTEQRGESKWFFVLRVLYVQKCFDWRHKGSCSSKRVEKITYDADVEDVAVKFEIEVCQ